MLIFYTIARIVTINHLTYMFFFSSNYKFDTISIKLIFQIKRTITSKIQTL